MPLHPDISRVLSQYAAYSVFEIETYLSGIWKGRAALAKDDQPAREWNVNQIEAELKAAAKLGEVCLCPGGWLMVPLDQRPKPSAQRRMFE